MAPLPFITNCYQIINSTFRTEYSAIGISTGDPD